MSLRARITLIFLVSLLIAIGFVLIEKFDHERDLEVRIGEGARSGVEASWTGVTLLEEQRLTKHLQPLLEDARLTEAIELGDAAKIDRATMMTQHHLSEDGHQTGIRVWDAGGELLFKTTGTLSVAGPALGKDQLQAVLLSREPVIGMMMSADGSVVFAAMAKVSGDGLPIGVISLHAPVVDLLAALSAFVDGPTGFLGLDGDLLSESKPGHVPQQVTAKIDHKATVGFQFLDSGDGFFQVVRLPVIGAVDGEIGAVLSIRDISEIVGADRRHDRLIHSALVIKLTLFIIGLNVYLRRAFRPLEDVVQSLQALNEGRSTVPVRVTRQNDEVGRLAGLFESLRKGIEARARLTSLQQELDVAARIQRQILPSRFPVTPRLTFCGRMHAARDVGGDFYDAFELPDGRIGCVIADVSGKGMGAALFMAAARTVIRSIAAASSGVADCIAKANDYLESDNDSMMFVTVFYAILDAETGEVRYCNAGHNPPVKLNTAGRVELLSASENPALGVLPGVEFIEHTTVLQPGERLFLFTDGITEAMTSANEEYGDGRLADALSGNSGRSAEDLADAVLASVATFVAGAEQSDDITCLVIAHDPERNAVPTAS